MLQNAQVPDQLIKTIHNINKKNLMVVKVGIEYSDWKSINQDVHQGCSFPPVIYNIQWAPLS